MGKMFLDKTTDKLLFASGFTSSEVDYKLKKDFLKYLGGENDLFGYQRSYKLVFYKCFFELIGKGNKVKVYILTQCFKQFYLNRKKKGLVPDINVDAVINNIETSNIESVFNLIKRNPFTAIVKKGFITLEEKNDELYFVLNPQLRKELKEEDVVEILRIVDKKLDLYFSRIDDFLNEKVSLKEIIEKILNDYIQAKSEKFTGHIMGSYFRNEIPSKFYQIELINADKYLVAGSVGQGTWAMVPWVCIFNRKITTSATKGVYIVYLLSKDGQTLYLTLNQGCTNIRGKHSKQETIEIMRKKAGEIVKCVDPRGFTCDEDINLGKNLTELAELYQRGVIFYKAYRKNDVPPESELREDLKIMLEIYDEYVSKMVEDADELREDKHQFVATRKDGVVMNRENIQVGKYTLESLTTGMYSDPKIVYREYIQNSVDSLESAVKNNILEAQSMRIDIVINPEEAVISIRDNGMGISCIEAKETLTNVGNSKKRQANNRGFRGIGRLGGMSYCDELIFTTSAENENKKTVVKFDCKKLRNLLIPGQYEDMTLSAVLNEITTVTFEYEKNEKHYFLVEMKGVNSFSNLLDIDSVKSYISQVAPLPYQSRYFIYSSQLHEYLNKNGYSIEEFPIFVGENERDLEPLYKPNRSRFHSDRNKMKADEINKMVFFDVTIDEEVYALGWYGDCEWYGSLSEPEISGFRVRKGNILIGDNKTLNGIFRESRFNGWTQGELFVITDKLIPNARRDDFEQNQSYFQLLDSLSNGVGLDITKSIREASLTRNDASSKIMREITKKIEEATNVLNEGFNSTVDKEKLIEDLTVAAEKLTKTKPKDDEQNKRKEQLELRIGSTVEAITESKKYKLNQVNSGIDKKSKKILSIVSNILSTKLSKFLVDEIIEEIIKELNGK